MDEDSFETHDIYLAAYFQVAGCEFIGKRRQGHRVFFKFRNPGGSMEALRTAFYAGTGKVSANTYADQVKNFKELCFFENS